MKQDERSYFSVSGEDVPEIPSAVSKYVAKTVVDVSQAHPYYWKHWNKVLPLVASQVHDLKKRRYQLKAEFFKFFVINLKAEFNSQPRNLKDADRLAVALFEAAVRWQRWGQGDLPTRLYQVWQSSKPIECLWRRFGDELSVPGDASLMLEYSGSPAMRSLKPVRDFQEKAKGDRLEIRVSFNRNRSELPEMNIRIIGAPILTLMEAMQNKGAEAQTIREESNGLLKSLQEYLPKLLGLRYVSGGRPVEPKIAQAAYLREFGKLKWRQIAERLCDVRHDHNESCQAKFRNGVQHYWKSGLPQLIVNSSDTILQVQ